MDLGLTFGLWSLVKHKKCHYSKCTWRRWKQEWRKHYDVCAAVRGALLSVISCSKWTYCSEPREVMTLRSVSHLVVERLMGSWNSSPNRSVVMQLWFSFVTFEWLRTALRLKNDDQISDSLWTEWMCKLEEAELLASSHSYLSGGNPAALCSMSCCLCFPRMVHSPITYLEKDWDQIGTVFFFFNGSPVRTSNAELRALFH